MNDVRLQGSTITNMNMLVAEKQIDVVLRGGAINAIPAVQTLFASDVDTQTAGRQRREKGFGLEPDAVIVVRAEDIDRLFLPQEQNDAERVSEFIVAKTVLSTCAFARSHRQFITTEQQMLDI